jgi:seryl-tRNA synthetase
MLDIKFIRENKKLIEAGAIKKHIRLDIDFLLKTDDERKTLIQSVESKRKEQNDFNDEVVKASKDEKEKLVEKMKKLKMELQKEEDSLKKIMEKWQEMMLKVPNIPDMSVPDGKTEADNEEIKTWGEKPEFSYEPKNHIELMESLEMLDLERGAKVS